MASWITADKHRSIDDGLYGLTVSAGKDINIDWTIEGSASYFKLDSDGGKELNEYVGGVDVLRKVMQNPYISPYFVIGGGFIRTEKPRGGDEGRAMASAGVGLLAPMKWRGASFRFEGRVRQDFSSGDDGYTDWIANVGLQFPFGARSSRSDSRAGAGKKAQQPLPASTLPPPSYPPPDESQMDTDGDGVPDERDMCGGTPAGRSVDKFGCATAEEQP